MNLPTLRVAIVVLTVATAGIHLVLSATAGLMFALNGLGYLALLAAVLVPLPFLAGRQALVHYAFMAYTAVTIVAYFAVNGGEAFSNPLGLATKVVEVLLIAALWFHLQRSAR